MSLLGYDNNDKTLSGDVEIYATNVYATNLYDGAVNVGDTLITLQDEIDALEAQINSSGTTGYYGLYGSSNNPTNLIANTERSFYFNQTLAQNGFSITGGTGVSATRITATYAGVYNIYYKANYQKVNNTNIYEVRTWLMKNGVDLGYSATIDSLLTNAQWKQISGQYIVSLAAGDYLEVQWIVTNVNSTTDILDYQAAASVYAAVASQFVAITQVANTDTGLDAVFNVASTNTLPAGSSASVVDTITTFPTYVNHSLVFNIPEGDKGDQGNPGATGAKGDKGDTGNTGPQGPKGDTGDTNATAIAALALATTAQATAVGAVAAIAVTNGAVSTLQAEVGTLQGQVGTLQTEMATANSNITTLQTKTQLQSFDAINTRTQFTNDLQLTGTATYRGAQIITTGSGTFFNVNTTEDINAGTDITATDSITAGTDLTIGGIAYLNRSQPSAKKLVLYDNNTGNNYEYLGMSVSTDGFNQFLNYNVNTAASEHRFLYGTSAASAKQILSLNPTETKLTTNSIDFRAKDITSINRDAGITISNNSSLSADLGTLGVYAGTINIGTQVAPSVVNIGSVGSFVNIIGVVSIPTGQNFSMINSFFQQF
jgi:hypothetical protein